MKRDTVETILETMNKMKVGEFFVADVSEDDGDKMFFIVRTDNSEFDAHIDKNFTGG